MSASIRVLHLHSGNLFGGIESILVTLAGHQDSRLEHVFALSFSGRLDSELRGQNADVRLTAPARISQPWTVRAARSALRGAVAEADYDVAICHSAWSRFVFGPVIGRRGQPLVFWQHSASDSESLIDRLARRVPAKIAVCNSRFTETRQAQREPGVPTAVIYPPVGPPNNDADRDAVRASIRADLRVSDDSAVILQVGRIEHGKGFSSLLQASAMLLDLPGWVIVFVGGGPGRNEVAYKKRLDSLVEELGLSGRVKFVGERDDVSSFYASADIYCQPALLPESFGITLVEAMYAGLPVVATKIGAATEVISNECGRLVTKGDLVSLSAELRRLITDGDERSQLGQSGPARASSLCGPAECMERLCEVLDRETEQ